MKNLATIILAAGKGTRMKSSKSKVLHEVMGKPIIHYVLDVAKAVGSLKTFVVIGHQSKEVSDAVVNRAQTVVQKKQLGTADAVRCAKSALKNHKGHVLILCGDTPLLDKSIIRRLISKHTKTKSTCTLLTAKMDNPFGYGRILRDSKGKIAEIKEQKDATVEESTVDEINVGVYCFKSDVLFDLIGKIKSNNKKKEYYLTDIIALLLSKGNRVETLVTNDQTAALGVNTRQDLALAHQLMSERILDKHMSNGVTIVDPSTTYIESDVKIAQDTVIYPCCAIHNNVRIGKNCSIGPFARLRAGSTIKNNVTVGNFIEISRSEIGNNSIAKHFSFLGDTKVGRSANIGAGTVTANYDGQNKSRTIIGDQAFIGSDTVLVAPTAVGKKAKTAAGSVVVKKTIPNGALAVGVPAKLK